MAKQSRIIYRNIRIYTKFRLISVTPQDPRFRSGLKSTQPSRVGSGKKGVNISHYRYVSLILVVLFLLPFYAYAGVFSFISNIFSSNNASAEEVTENSQNMALLQAPISPSVDASTTKKDVPIANGTSLLPEPQITDSTADHTADSDQISVYVVHQGDTLPAVAKMFGVTVNTIAWSNDIKGNKITPGQTLVILPISGIQHVVKKGDTIKSIATLHKGDIDEIMQYNNLSKDSKLAVGDIIIVPDGEMGPTISKPTTTKGNASTGTVKTSSYPVYDGYYMRPIIGGVKTQGLHGHNGVDLASSFGSNILAAAAGTVIVSKNSGWNGGYGSYVVISHSNGTQTLYAHLSATLVSNGDHVEQGQVIARMGSTGNSSGTHLHFEVRGARNPF